MANIPEMPAYLKCSDIPPPVNKLCLCLWAASIYPGLAILDPDRDGEWILWGSGESVITPDYWLPMPMLPIEVIEGE